MSYHPRPKAPARSFLVLSGLVLAAWFTLILALGAQDAFHAPAGEAPVATLGAILVPPLLFLALMATVPAFRAQILSIDPVWLAAVHGLRILGAGFLFVHAFGHLPALFAHVAGWGDVLVAVLAPFVAVRLARDPSFIRSPALWGFHAIGLLDFVGAVGSGLISRGTLPLLGMAESTAALGQFPLLLIPCFAVPLWICFHIAAFAQINAARASVPQLQGA